MENQQTEEEGQRDYIVCVKEANAHTAESVLRKCDICFENVWCQPFNLLRIPICSKCAMEMPDAQFILNKENLDAAVEELRKRKRNAQ